MELKIIEETENALFKRKEVIVLTEAESVPSEIDVAKALAEKFSSTEDAIKVKTIKGNFGSKEFKIVANVYGSKADFEATEPQKNKGEGDGEDASAPETPATSAPSEGVPSEEGKEAAA
jgi:ribosomal protein S24E